MMISFFRLPWELGAGVIAAARRAGWAGVARGGAAVRQHGAGVAVRAGVENAGAIGIAFAVLFDVPSDVNGVEQQRGG